MEKLNFYPVNINAETSHALQKYYFGKVLDKYGGGIECGSWGLDDAVITVEGKRVELDTIEKCSAFTNGEGEITSSQLLDHYLKDSRFLERAQLKSGTIKGHNNVGRWAFVDKSVLEKILQSKGVQVTGDPQGDKPDAVYGTNQIRAKNAAYRVFNPNLKNRGITIDAVFDVLEDVIVKEIEKGLKLSQK